MKIWRKTFIALTSVVIAFPSFPLLAAAEEGNYSSKDEVVYATLHPNGNQEEIYVVNAFDVKKAGELVDYGSYTEIKNLTDLTEIEEKNNLIQFEAPEGKFYFQGNMDEKTLPWDISITYYLNGNKIAPEELAGKDGKIEIEIVTSANEEVDPVFFENYLLQIGLTLDPNIFTNIEAPDAMIANAGKNKQITFTVLPENEAELSIKAEVQNFELSGIDINGVPSNMAIDVPDLDSRLSDMHALTDAIRQVNQAVSELEKGVAELNGGVSELHQGSQQYKNGISEISGASGELVSGSKLIQEALNTISNSLSNADSNDLDIGSFQQLPEGLSLLSENLTNVANGMSALRNGYMEAYDALDQAITSIPNHQLSPEEIQGLYIEGVDHDVLNKLTETYTAALTAKGTYEAVKEGFDAVDTTLTELSSGIKKMGTELDKTAKTITTSLQEMDITKSIEQLQSGLTELSTNYKEFHNGLVEYTGGVNQLSGAYGELHDGIGQLSNGTNELESGVNQLHDGTNELYTETSDLPAQMKEQIDEMISEFENTDFEAKSFVSSKNDEKVNSVQFVLKTESIEMEDVATEEEPVEEEKGFWDRLWDLFS